MKRLLQKGFLLSACKGLETLLGFSFALLMVWKFGAGPDTDALFGSTVLAVGIFNMIPTMMSQVLIPTLIAEELTPAKRQGFLGSICSASLAVGVVFLALSLLFPQLLLAVGAPGLKADSFQLAAHFTLALAPVYLCTLVFGLLQGVLQAERRFFAVEAGQLVWKAAPVAAIILAWDYGLLAVALSYSAGAMLRLLVVIWAFGPRRLPELRPRVPCRSHFPQRSSRLLCTEGILVALDWGTELLIRALASLLPVGGLSVFNYAERFCRSLPGTVLRGFGVVLLPDMARVTALGGPEEKN